MFDKKKHLHDISFQIKSTKDLLEEAKQIASPDPKVEKYMKKVSGLKESKHPKSARKSKKAYFSIPCSVL